VVPSLYAHHRGEFLVKEWPLGQASALDAKARYTVNAVLRFYGNRSAQWLSDLTHAEKPWKKARNGLAEGERGDREIPLDAMMEYYSSLPPPKH
jgi:uncharacterized phage-associated protein